jgi:hypothetical protein
MGIWHLITNKIDSKNEALGRVQQNKGLHALDGWAGHMIST